MSSSEAVQDAGPQKSLRYSSFGLDGNQNLSLGRNIWKRGSGQESKPYGKWLELLCKSSQYTTGSLKMITIGKIELAAANSTTTR